MIRKVNEIWYFILALLIVELFICGILYLSGLNIISLRFLLFVTVNNIVIGIAILMVKRIIHKEGIELSDSLTEETNNIFVYGGIGIISYDENRNAIWVSDLFKEKGLDITGKKILEWQPLLAPVFDYDDVIVVDINSRKYEVYNNKTSRMLYLKDTSDLVALNKEVIDQRICIGYILIDNYEETIEYMSEEKSVDVETILRDIVISWAKNNGISIKRYKNNMFLLIFNDRTYRKLVEEKFNVLKNFRDATKKMDQMMTLSIGVGRSSKIIRENDQLAFSALQLANSRGGDQVVIKTKDEVVLYFGGTTQSTEKESRVKSRVISQALSGLIKKADNVFIMGHKLSDFDSFGGSVALYILCRYLGKEANIILDFDSIESKTKAAALQLRNNLEYKSVIISPTRAMEIKRPNTLLVVVDNHKASLAISTTLAETIKNVVVIDHHRRGEEFIKLPLLTYLEPAASSTVELITELFEYHKHEVKVTPEEATILYAGMLVDTNYFKVRVSSRTFQVASKLKDYQADVGRAYQYLEDDYQTTIDKFSLTKNNYRLGDDMLIAYGLQDTIYSRTLLAKAGNELMMISEIKAVFVVGRTDKNEVSISARSTNDVNVQLIMEKLGGGGHFSMAATQIKSEDVFAVVNQLEKAINQYLDERKSS